jgi:hypothetical protein
MADKQFYNVKAFVETNGKKKVVDCGFLYENGKGGFSIKLTSIPVAGWDGSLLAELPRPKDDSPIGFP